jgi:kynurenine formamidase
MTAARSTNTKPPLESLGFRLRESDPRELGAVAREGPVEVLAALRSVESGRIFDLDPGRFPGMPQWEGHPPFMLTTYRSPHGTRIQDDLELLTAERNSRDFRFVSELMVTGMHVGAHLDALCHAVVDGDWHGGFAADDEVGDFGARRSDAATIPPIIVSGLLLDVAGHRGVDHLPGGERIGADELADVAAALDLDSFPGGAVLIRTGAMCRWPDPDGYGRVAGAGIDLSGARWLVEQLGATLVGADTPAVEQQPSADPDNPHPVHSFLLRDCGIHQLECLWLEQLARQRVYRFAFICLPLKVAGATASMVRPIAVV